MSFDTPIMQVGEAFSLGGSGIVVVRTADGATVYGKDADGNWAEISTPAEIFVNANGSLHCTLQYALDSSTSNTTDTTDDTVSATTPDSLSNESETAPYTGADGLAKGAGYVKADGGDWQPVALTVYTAAYLNVPDGYNRMSFDTPTMQVGEAFSLGGSGIVVVRTADGATVYGKDADGNWAEISTPAEIFVNANGSLHCTLQYALDYNEAIATDTNPNAVDQLLASVDVDSLCTSIQYDWTTFPTVL
jgi:hypothetical protein